MQVQKPLIKGKNMGIREKIIKELLHKIEVDMDAVALKDSVNVFSEFIRALTLESEMTGTHKDKIASEIAASASSAVLANSWINVTKQQAEAANAYAKELGALFQQQGDHQKERDDIFAKIAKNTSDSFSVFKANVTPLMAESMTAKVTESENEANLLPVKGQEFHVYTDEPPSTLDEVPSGELLCKAIFGESVPIIASGKASYGLLVKNNHYVRMMDISTVPAKDAMSVGTLNFIKGTSFTISNW